VELSKRNRFNPDAILTKIVTARRLAYEDGHKPGPLPDDRADLEILLRGKMELHGLMPWSSNYTFLVSLQDQQHPEILAIYKPGDGERPLWDFPNRTLSLREFASYLVSQVLGWPSIPSTVMRDGPHGLGSVQRFIEAEYEAHYFNMRDIPHFAEDFRRLALFDYIVNNADRKGGHCLKGKDGRIWAIDHGLTFHVEPKLRTVIWEFCDERIPDLLLNTLAHLQCLINQPELCQVLADLITSSEIEAFRKRINRLVSTGKFPQSRAGRNFPYPPI
jgi:uncharacterized repeat protein (TIGR03843 family)